MIAIIDYGAGNLSSVVKALNILGHDPVVTSEAEMIDKYQTLVLPGVGAAGDAMTQLRNLNMTEKIIESINRGVPFLGICLGMQVLLTKSEESGGEECLGVVPGEVRKLPDSLKVPHMGWNQIRQRISHPIFTGISDNAYFYFVHSYYVQPTDKGVIAADTEYSTDFCSLIASDNVVATQFHPEKSGKQGLKLLQNFLRFAGLS